MATANGATVTYDAFGKMVELHNGTSGSVEFAYSPAGGPALSAAVGQSIAMAWVPLPGGASAVYTGSGLTYYAHPDWLGSTRLVSSPSRSASPMMAFAPFGEGYAGGIPGYVTFTSGGYAFTVFDKENQTGSLEDFMFRRYSPGQGRWISPDPAGLAAVDPSNPQSWNRYAYVSNNPLRLIDPSGLDDCLLQTVSRRIDVAYIPPGEKWFVAEIVEEISVEDDPRNLVHLNLVLVQASSPDEAYERACQLGNCGETTYRNPDGKKVTVRFRGLAELVAVYDELEHGAELLYKTKTSVDESQIQKWITPREKLAAFRDDSEDAGVPDYRSQDIVEELVKRFDVDQSE